MLGHAIIAGCCPAYMCGSGTHPGGGVTGAPGHNAAREIIGDFRRRRLHHRDARGALVLQRVRSFGVNDLTFLGTMRNRRIHAIKEDAGAGADFTLLLQDGRKRRVPAMSPSSKR